MYRELAASLRHIGEAADDRVALDRAALGTLCNLLDEGVPHEPLVFASYYAAVAALLSGSHEEASEQLARVVGARAMPEPQVVSLADLGTETAARYASMVEADEPCRLALASPGARAAAAFRSRLADAMQLIDAAVPPLSEEIGHLARQIVLVDQRPDREGVFDGGSHYQLWNALFLNIGRPRSRVALAEVVVHECAHSLLFGFTVDEALTLNGGDALYASPLREDPRPLDGIYHATFVSARMAWFLARLLESPLLDAGERREADRALARDLANFADGDAIIAEHGRLSRTGSEILDGARAFVATC